MSGYSLGVKFGVRISDHIPYKIRIAKLIIPQADMLMTPVLSPKKHPRSV